ncbi:MAG: hypothetical protein ACRDTZ_05595 [Pseudonocardiaceae bacterium]
MTGLSLVIVSLSISRLGSFTEHLLKPHDFLRWLDFNAMLPIPIASIVLYYLLKKDLEVAGETARTILLWLTARRWTQMPFTLYIAAAFGVGLTATLLYTPFS